MPEVAALRGIGRLLFGRRDAREVPCHAARKHGPDDVPQLLLGCGSHALHGPELLDEFPGRLLADALDLAKLGMKRAPRSLLDRKSTRLNSSHVKISYAVFCLKK